MLIVQLKKQSNQDWNMPIHLKNNDPHIKSLSSFDFLSWLLNYVFITNCRLNGYVYILEIILVILNKLIYDSQNVHEMLIKLISLIICSINGNLTNAASTSPPEVKKAVLYFYIVNLIILCTSTETSIYLKLKNKIFNFF